MENRISKKQLLTEVNNPEILEDRRPPITGYVLRVWQQRGVIPSPSREGKGKGKGKGVEVYYPHHTIDQIKRLISILEEHRSLDKALLSLWVEGFPVDYKPVLREGLKTYKKWWNGLLEIRENETSLSEKTYQMIYNRYQENNKHGSKTFATAGKRVKRDYDIFKKVLLQLITGTDDIFTDGDLAIFEKGLGFNQSVENGLFSWKDISEWCSPPHIEEMIENGSDKDLRITYLFLSGCLDVLMEFPEMRKALKGFPIYQFANKEKTLLVILLSIISIYEKSKDDQREIIQG